MQARKLFSLFLLTMLVSLPLQAEVELDSALKEKLVSVFGGQPDQVSETPLKELLEVTYGAQVFYLSKDGDYLINGEMFDLNTRTNLTKQRLAEARQSLMAQVDESDMIIYKAKGKEKHVISVFTDIDCVYCRKLHKGMDEMNALGITVRYLAYPRAGLNSPSYDKAVSVWCAGDRNKAMDSAKNEDKVSNQRCDNAPVKAQMQLGQSVGVSGTPAMVFSDGSLMPGYLPPKRLAETLEKNGN
ncbi:MAG: thioredoxin fold domain-containing protein [Gammaproteobacteria bacterium]|nr:thioredoxin fold domain-containing protein [Gammaproteobacteria bacterium]MCW8927369.1 thioredoxin fold domain-containing protein [Gammaproteobacteria bacterium]MCW8958554.1 thioredoxin fold domain-containing protein [Gammaproteobacteria bacterium]MCW8971803.1 thioredoxin fold domain-containing protein [Gammaproteobacteria bacterium]MCW8994000.1 thioredoxin fold domain-containing protein [Gammaproteobacteria bacterium]